MATAQGPGHRQTLHGANGNDPGEKEPLGIYWYEPLKTEKGTLEWVKHVIDYGGRAGGGMQVTVAGQRKGTPIRRS